MENDGDFKKLWTQPVNEPPQVEELLSNFEKNRRKNLTTLIAVNFLMLATIGCISFIWYYFQPKLITTKIGIVLTFFGIVVYLIFYNQLTPGLKKVNENMSKSEFLKAVIQLKEQEKFLQTKMLQIYFITVTFGLCLYLYEFVSLIELPWSIFTYLIIFIWVGFNWFYLRPRVVAKQQNKLDEVIKDLKMLNARTKNDLEKVS